MGVTLTKRATHQCVCLALCVAAMRISSSGSKRGRTSHIHVDIQCLDE